MNHQPYETWLFEQDNLSHNQLTGLRDHLRQCPHCQNLEHAWEDLRHSIKSAPLVKPERGFSERWRYSLNTRRELERRNQMWNFFLSLTATTFFFLLFIGNQILIAGSPIDWIFSTVQGTIHMFTTVWKAIITLSGWIQIIPSEIKVPVLFSIVISFFILSSLWFYMVLNIQKLGANRYEME